MSRAIQGLLAGLLLCGAYPQPALAQSTPTEALNQFTVNASERELARAIGTLCAAGNRVSDRLQQDCNSLVGSAFGNDVRVQGAIAQLIADNANVATDRTQFGIGNLAQALTGSSAVRGSGPGLGFLPVGPSVYSASEQFAAWSVFANLDFEDFSRDRSLNEDGFDGDRQALTIGIDRRFGDAFSAGAALSLSRSDLDLTGGSGRQDIDERRLLLFANWSSPSGFYFDALVSIARSDTDQDRRAAYSLTSGTQIDQTYRSDFDSDSTSIAAALGYSWQRENMTLSPFLAIENSSLDVDGYQERASSPSGNGAGWAIAASDADSDITTVDLGVRANWAISGSSGVWIPQLEVAYVNVVDQDENAAQMTFVGDQSSAVALNPLVFALANDREDDDYFRLGAGLIAQWSRGRSGFINISTRLGEDAYDSTIVTLGARLEF